MQLDLDLEYPHLAALVSSTLGLTLEALSKRAPADDFQYFDLERLCHFAKETAPFVEHPLIGAHSRMTLGYLAVIDEYVALGVVKEPERFVSKKLCAPATARSTPLASTEFLDTLTECQWALYFVDEGYTITEEEAALPGGGDADFRITRGPEELWVDCFSPDPQDPKPPLEGWLAKKASQKWRAKFGRDPAAASLPSAIAMMMMKADDMVPAFGLRAAARVAVVPPADTRLWTDCPALQRVVVGYPPFQSRSPRPSVLCDWRR